MVSPLQRSPAVSHQVLDGQAVILDERGEVLITLNDVGTLVWEALDGSRDTDALVDELADKFDGVSRDQLRADIIAFIEQLQAGHLVRDSDPDA